MSRARARHAQLHLPPLRGEEACRLVNILERTIRAVWRAHGDEMADVMGRDHPAPETLEERPAEAIVSDPDGADEAAFDSDFPF